MAKVIMICGKICCGKSTYSEQLRKESSAVLLSVDEIMLAIFDQHAGDRHDEYAKNTQNFLFNKSVELVGAGVNVILDWGFWRKTDRDWAREFYRTRNMECEFHYIDVSEEVWKQRLEKRNHAVLAGETDAYFVDENLAGKFASTFEMPEESEIDVWVR